MLKELQAMLNLDEKYIEETKKIAEEKFDDEDEEEEE